MIALVPWPSRPPGVGAEMLSRCCTLIEFASQHWNPGLREPKSFLKDSKFCLTFAREGDSVVVILDTKQTLLKTGKTLYFSGFTLYTSWHRNSLKQRQTVPLLTRSAEMRPLENCYLTLAEKNTRFFLKICIDRHCKYLSLTHFLCLYRLFKSFWWIGTFFQNVNALSQVLLGQLDLIGLEAIIALVLNFAYFQVPEGHSIVDK